MGNEKSLVIAVIGIVVLCVVGAVVLKGVNTSSDSVGGLAGYAGTSCPEDSEQPCVGMEVGESVTVRWMDGKSVKCTCEMQMAAGTGDKWCSCKVSKVPSRV